MDPDVPLNRKVDVLEARPIVVACLRCIIFFSPPIYQKNVLMINMQTLGNKQNLSHRCGEAKVKFTRLRHRLRRKSV